MDEITKLKAEAYDLVATIQNLQNQLEAKNQQIIELLQAGKPTQPKDPVEPVKK